MPYPGLLYPESLPLQRSSADLYLHRRHSNTVLSQSLGIWGSWCTQGLFEPSEHLWQIWGLILNWFYPSNCLVGAFPLPLDMGYLLKVAPAPRSCHYNVYPLARASLPLVIGYLLKVSPAPAATTPVPFSHWRRLYTWASPGGQYRIRLIIFFASKEGKALHSQQKQDWELTVAEIMNSLLPNLDLNWRK